MLRAAIPKRAGSVDSSRDRSRGLVVRRRCGHSAVGSSRARTMRSRLPCRLFRPWRLQTVLTTQDRIGFSMRIMARALIGRVIDRLQMGPRFLIAPSTAFFQAFHRTRSGCRAIRSFPGSGYSAHHATCRQARVPISTAISSRAMKTERVPLTETSS